MDKDGCITHVSTLRRDLPWLIPEHMLIGKHLRDLNELSAVHTKGVLVPEGFPEDLLYLCEVATRYRRGFASVYCWSQRGLIYEREVTVRPVARGCHRINFHHLGVLSSLALPHASGFSK